MTNLWILLGVAAGGTLIGTALCWFVDQTSILFRIVEDRNVEK